VQDRHSRLDESGQTMAEYAVTIGVITIGVVVAFTLIGNAMANVISSVVTII